MALPTSISSFAPTHTLLSSTLWHGVATVYPPSRRRQLYEFRSAAGEDNPTSDSATRRSKDSEPEKPLLLRVAWYGSELLGITASAFRPPPSSEAPPAQDLQLPAVGSGALDRSVVVDKIKEDFQRSYFVTGELTLDAYEDDCEFADPAGSFKGLRRFKRNCANFGSLIERSNMKLMKWEDHEDKGIGDWRFSCIMSFPWRPILSATGYTEYYFNSVSGKVCRHVEYWNVPKLTLLKQLLRPTRWFWDVRREMLKILVTLKLIVKPREKIINDWRAIDSKRC